MSGSHPQSVLRRGLGLLAAGFILAVSTVWSQETLVPLPPRWRLASERMTDFPARGLQLYVLEEAGSRPRRAFCLAWDTTTPGIALKPVLYAAGRTTTEHYLREPGRVYAAANGGFFGGGQSYSLVLAGGAVLAPNIKALTRSYLGANTTYYPTRVAFGISPEGRPAADWIYHVGSGNDQIVAYPVPSSNLLGRAPQPVPTAAFPAGGVPWRMSAAIGGSPMLVRDGVVRVSDAEELIEIDNAAPRPRTAIGHTGDGVVLLLAVEGDGSPGPAGVTLAELAGMMVSLGARQAVNLDGGGSTSLAVGGLATVRPTGGVERAVASAVLLVDPRSQVPVTAAPAVLHAPWDLALAPGGTGILQVAAAGGRSFQWRRDGVVLPGATAAALVVEGGATAAGRYEVTVANALGSVTADAARVTLAPGGGAGLMNLSVRADGGVGEDALVAGFVVRDGAKTVLVRGVGPGLTALGLPGALQDPRLELTTTDAVRLAANDDWVAGETGAVASGVGAFPLAPGSRDAGLVVRTQPGGHLAAVAGGSATDRGTVLLEVYDAGGEGALVNLSARARVSAAGGPLIAGFVVRGPAPATVLIRAVGPSLSAFGVAGALATPVLTLVREGQTLLSNRGWAAAANAEAIWDAARRSGAFAVPAGAADAAMLVTLPPGAYSAVVSSAGAAEGVALVELYEVR